MGSAKGASRVGLQTDKHEPFAWAEELIEPARAIDHPRLTALYVVASSCCMAGRIDPAIRYTEVAERAISGGSDHAPYGAEGYLGSAHVAVGQPQRWVQWCRAQLARGRDTHAYTRACLVIGLMITGSIDDTMAAAGLMDAAEATGNPRVISWALLAYGYAFRDADPDLALEASRRGLVIAQDSGNRFNESILVYMLAFLEAEHGDWMAELDSFTVAIHNYHESGKTYMISAPLALLAASLDRLGRYESAGTVAGFSAVNPMTAALPELDTAIGHLREVLGGQTYERLAREGEAMTTAAIVSYAYDQIDEARAELKAVSK